MQSQQKRVKWSRGETAEALEERTDTGITQASVELMENCIPDIYGNISRRPAIEFFDSLIHDSQGFAYSDGFIYDEYLQVIPFYINESDIVLIGVHANGDYLEYIRIKDNKFYGYAKTTTACPQTKAHIGFISGTEYAYKPVSFSQQNNYLIVADEYNVYKIQIDLNNLGVMTPTTEIFRFSAGWYAPYGTQTKQVSATELPGLNVSGSFASYTYTNNTVGDTNVYSWTDTGLDGQTNLEAILVQIPLGSIIQFPNNGAYLRVEGYVLDNNNVMVYGELLTPVANENTTDTRLKVEYGYVKLMPSSYSFEGSYPHPTKVAFSNQRLWAGDWKFGAYYNNRYSLVVGSQIAKYNDFENNYNQDNEAVTLDILTQFKEKIVHLGDFSGLKIMTDAFEYDYSNGEPIKQSANGSLEVCEPIIFDSLCLYVDSTGCQVKAMQYEFQANIFNSSTINQFAPHDLVWYPLAIGMYEDKTHNTGKYLFLKNEESDEHPCLAVCNFVPGNQATIWNRWNFPKIINSTEITGNLIHNIVNTKTQTIFLVKTQPVSVDEYGNANQPRIVPAILNWEKATDLETSLYLYNNKHYVAFARNGNAIPGSSEILTLPNTQVSVYSDGVFQFLTTTDADGVISDDISQLTNITVGLPINATVRSHPIDVGGKTKSIKKRIGKTVMSVHNTEAGAITINGKTGYMNPQGDKISFYGVTGMKDEIRYTITNKNGAMFHLESLLMNIEYGTLDS